MEKLAYVFWTTDSKKEARALTKKLLEKKFIVCANIIDAIESLYVWDDEIEETEEVKVIFKTFSSYYQKILDFLKKESCYDVPEVSLIEVNQANPDYYDWALDYLS